jgi:hypothetical protein
MPKPSAITIPLKHIPIYIKRGRSVNSIYAFRTQEWSIRAMDDVLR